MIYLKDNKVYIKTSYEDKDKCKKIPSGAWDKRTNSWVYPLDALLDIRQYFALPKELIELADRMQGALTYTNRLKTNSARVPPHEFLLAHQRKCLEIARAYPRYAFFLDTGTGKTVTSLAIINDNKDIKWMVVCPKALIRSAWINDAKYFFPDLKIRPLSKNFKKKELATMPDIEDADILIVNPESFDVDIATQYCRGLIFDESVKLKNPQAKITKAITDATKQMERVYLLSGEPAPNNEMEYFAQLRIVSPAAFGDNFYRFRENYFVPYGYGGYQWRFDETKRNLFTQRLDRYSIFIAKDECVDLPDKTFIVRDIELSAQAMKYYNEMYRRQVLELDDITTIAPNKLTQLMKLRQITSGFLIDSEGTGQHLHDDKLNELMNTLEEIGNKQVVIWCNFKNEIRAIKILLGDKAVTAYSETQDVDESVARFRNKEVQYIIAHPQTLKYGVTFTQCTYTIYYSLSYSYDDFKQSQDRIHRIGQKNKCTYIFLIAKDTIDGVIYETLQHKGDMAEAIKELVKSQR